VWQASTSKKNERAGNGLKNPGNAKSDNDLLKRVIAELSRV
jgi:hypothetical protein